MSKHEIKRIKTSTCAQYGTAGLADTFLTFGITTLVMPIYNIGMGIDAKLIGWALVLPPYSGCADRSVDGQYFGQHPQSIWSPPPICVFGRAALRAALSVRMDAARGLRQCDRGLLDRYHVSVLDFVYDL